MELLPVHPAVLAVLDLMCERRGERETGKDGKSERGREEEREGEKEGKGSV